MSDTILLAALVLLLACATLSAAQTLPALSSPKLDAGNTRVLWLESATVWSPWEGPDLARVVDEQSGRPCLEWSQTHATHGTATLTLTGVDPAQYDALRLQWKYLGGGSALTAEIGQRRWYLFKERYEPAVWHDAWVELALDDDLGGPLLDE